MCLSCLHKMNSADGQVYSVCKLQFSCFTKYNRIHSKHKQTNCKHYSFLSRYNYTKSKNYLKRLDIEFVTEFPCLLGHPVTFQ